MNADFSKCLVYGATGYTGVILAERAASLGLAPILAGRSAAKLRPLGERFSMPTRAFGLDDPAAIDAGLAEVDVLIHCAGPFSQTSRPMVDACLRTRTHYLDITGEVDVFEACARRDDEATRAGVMLMPGVGFDVVPSDCLALHVSRRLPGATHLVLAISGVGSKPSHGTATTIVESLGRPNLVRRDGALTEVRSGSLRRKFDFGRGEEAALGIAWGDVSTAFRTTGIPNIEVYMRVPSTAIVGARVLGFAGAIMRAAPMQRLLKSRIAEGGPTESERERGFSILIGEASRGTERVTSRLRVAEGYTLTAHAALEIASRTLSGAAEPGHRTPAMLFGPDLILELGGQREDLP